MLLVSLSVYGLALLPGAITAVVLINRRSAVILLDINQPAKDAVVELPAGKVRGDSDREDRLRAA